MRRQLRVNKAEEGGLGKKAGEGGKGGWWGRQVDQKRGIIRQCLQTPVELAGISAARRQDYDEYTAFL